MISLTDGNFEKEIQNSPKPVLVDFFAEWCTPCFVLAPILEKLTEDFENKFVLAKVNLDKAPLTAQKFGVERIPMVVFFNQGKPIQGFVGLRPEPLIREWLGKMLEEGNSDKQIEGLIKKYEDYAKENGLVLNPDREVVKRLARGLLENEKKYGERYCPCRRISGDKEEDKAKICPCQWHKEEIEKQGHCLCGLFVKR